LNTSCASLEPAHDVNAEPPPPDVVADVVADVAPPPEPWLSCSGLAALEHASR
jgi:hypothetical protein